jgi:hypothetical protein
MGLEIVVPSLCLGILVAIDHRWVRLRVTWNTLEEMSLSRFMKTYQSTRLCFELRTEAVAGGLNTVSK